MAFKVPDPATANMAPGRSATPRSVNISPRQCTPREGCPPKVSSHFAKRENQIEQTEFFYEEDSKGLACTAKLWSKNT